MTVSGDDVMQTTADASAIQEALGRFVERILADPALEPYRAATDEQRLRRRAKAFMIGALGGPDLYPDGVDAPRRTAAIGDEEFDRITGMLIDCLGEAGVSADVLALTRRRADGLRPRIPAA